MLILVVAFLVMTACILVGDYKIFGRMYYPHQPDNLAIKLEALGSVETDSHLQDYIVS
jgi:hypothetical protein